MQIVFYSGMSQEAILSSIQPRREKIPGNLRIRIKTPAPSVGHFRKGITSQSKLLIKLGKINEDTFEM